MIIFGEVTKNPTFLIFFLMELRGRWVDRALFFPIFIPILVKNVSKTFAFISELRFFSLNDKNIFKPDCSPCVQTGNLNATYQKLIRHHHQMIHRHASYLHLYKSPLLLGGIQQYKKKSLS